MGSLLAGWDSPVLDPEKVRHERNKSLTKEEIETFWRARRRSLDGEEEEELRSPKSPMKKMEPKSPSDKDAKLKATGDWWTRSNWAFLNEPPQEEGPETGHKYTAQFHVAHVATSETTSEETKSK